MTHAMVPQPVVRELKVSSGGCTPRAMIASIGPSFPPKGRHYGGRESQLFGTLLCIDASGFMLLRNVNAILKSSLSFSHSCHRGRG